MRHEQPQQWQSTWNLILAAFVIAGSAGVAFRFGMIRPLSVDPVKLRHAHSHLMAFGWLTPALFLFMTRYLISTGIAVSVRLFGGVLGISLFLAFCSFPAFYLYGYGTADFWGVRLPPAVLVSTAGMFTWYAFAFIWWYDTRACRRTMPLLLWDAALAFLVLSTLGAWGITAVQAGVIHGAEPKMLTHWFLWLFEEGWCVLALLGIAFAWLKLEKITPARLLGLGLLAMGLPFSVGLALGDGGEFYPNAGKIGGWMAAVGLLQLAVEGGLVCLRTGHRAWAAPMGFLTIKGLCLLAAALLPLLPLMQHMGSRLLYLHILLLGGMSLGLLAAAHYSGLTVRGLPLMRWSVVMLLAAMLPFTALWPVSWFGAWSLKAVFLFSIPPVIVMALELAHNLFKQVRTMHPPQTAIRRHPATD